MRRTVAILFTVITLILIAFDAYLIKNIWVKDEQIRKNERIIDSLEMRQIGLQQLDNRLNQSINEKKPAWKR